MWLQEIWSRLRSSYWFVPLVVTAAGSALAFLLLLVDSRTEFDPPAAFWLVYPTSAEGSRALLSAIVSSIITVTSVTFSVTIVALTVAAQHFGPRVLNNFVRDTAAQLVLGTFIATFAYAVLVLGAIRGPEADGDLPQISVMGAVALVMVSVGAFIYYVHHVATALQVGHIAAEIARDFRHSVGRLHDAAEETHDSPEKLPQPPDDAAGVRCEASGYVARIDYRQLVGLARERDVRIWVRRAPGRFAIEGTPLALVSPPSACDDEFAARVIDAFILGRDRTLAQDSEFALKQLVEIALRALSPGVNEPFTAMTCIDRLSEGLAQVARAPRPRWIWRDEDERPRVFAEVQPFRTMLRAAFDPIRIFAGTNPAIYVRLLDSIGELALVARRPEDLSTLGEEAHAVRRSAESALEGKEDRDYMNARHRHTIQLLEKAGAPADTSAPRPREVRPA